MVIFDIFAFIYKKRYGYEYPSQNKDVLLERLRNGFKIKNFGDVYYQGSFEKDFLDKYYHKLKIENGFSIVYYSEGKKKSYLPDFFISDLDLLIEIKSLYWYRKNLEKCKDKEYYTKKKHNYILILDKDYREFDQILNNS